MKLRKCICEINYNIKTKTYEKKEGLFHEWGTDYEEFESGPGNYIVGIIEFEDGTIQTVYPYRIKFLDKELLNETK